MAYLSQDHLDQALARGQAVEQWLGGADQDGEPILKWVRIEKEPQPDLSYSVVLKKFYDEGSPILEDLSPLDVDAPWGEISSFETRDEALDFVVNELGGFLDRFVRRDEIQQEYEKYLSKRNSP